MNNTSMALLTVETLTVIKWAVSSGKRLPFFLVYKNNYPSEKAVYTFLFGFSNGQVVCNQR
jgi:hypothetical protein